MTSRDAVLAAAAVATGLMAGLFFAFSAAVMPGLARTGDRTMVEAMQRINAAIQNGWFLLVFAGALLLGAAGAVLCVRDGARTVLPWVVAGTVCYLLVLVVTFAVSIPLNDRLDAAGPPGAAADPAALRARFEAAWVRWNLLRTLLCTGALGCLAWALVLSGRAGAAGS
ncbi:anthrone oxygenase family protein [Streptomyces sp. NPDC046977]|uniref:anthrone oxygenase family protein n=1 Tax=Streptomyces sp. NPDC046977 TaxID=3154703 RepID=UPI0033F50EFD